MADEEAEFRGELKNHMKNTALSLKEIKNDVRRGADATDTLRVEVTRGFGEVSERISIVETDVKAQERRCDEHTSTNPAGNRQTAMVGGGSAVGIYALIEAATRFFKGNHS